MAFTYDLSATSGRVRLAIGDTVQGAGPRPGGANFSDEEIAALLTIEGSTQRASAACFEALSALWAAQPTDIRVGPRGESYSASSQFAKRAQTMRDTFGQTPGADTAPSTPGFVVGFRRDNE